MSFSTADPETAADASFTSDTAANTDTEVGTGGAISDQGDGSTTAGETGTDPSAAGETPLDAASSDQSNNLTDSQTAAATEQGDVAQAAGTDGSVDQLQLQSDTGEEQVQLASVDKQSLQ